MKQTSAAIFVVAIGLATIAPKCGDARKCSPDTTERVCPGQECYEFKQEGGDWQQICTPDPNATPTPVSTPTPSPTVEPSLPPSPQPSPSSTPIPTPPPDTDRWAGNAPISWSDIQNGVCPPAYKGEPVRVGVSFLSTRPCSGNCQRDGYLGFIINGSTTPHSAVPQCGHTCYSANGVFSTSNCAQRCEQLRGCQDGASDPTNPALGPAIRMRHATWGREWQTVDKRSDNNYNWHHKPRVGETGITSFRACHRGWEFDTDPRCGEMTLTVTSTGVENRSLRAITTPRKPVRWEEGE